MLTLGEKSLRPSKDVLAAVLLTATGAVAIYGLVFGVAWLQTPAVHARPDTDWRAGRNVPFRIQNGVELAREAPDKTFASFNLVCSAKGNVHMLLLTRLPDPDGFRPTRPWRDPTASIHAGDNFRNHLPIVADIVAIGDSNAPKASDRLETIVTPPLSRPSLSTLSEWFGSGPPERVSVGVGETGTFMTGLRDGQAIDDFVKSCASAP